MTPDRTRLYLRDMLAYARKATELVGDRSESDFAEDETIQLAVTRCVEIVGEACKSIPPKIRALAPNVPWRSIARMRDLLIHHYFGVKLDAVYKVARDDAPVLAREIESLLAKLEESTPPPTA